MSISPTRIASILEKQDKNPYYLPCPWEIVSDASGYQGHIGYVEPTEYESVTGNASSQKHMPAWVMQGFHNDKTRNWFLIKNRLIRNGFDLQPGSLDLTVIAPLNMPKGIQTDPDVKIRQPLYNFDHTYRRHLIGVLQNPNNDVTFNPWQKEICKGLYDPEKDTRKLKELSLKAQEWTDPNIEYNDKNYLGTRTRTPRDKVIPRRDQFPANVQKLTFGDIFTIFQGAELESIQLGLGRACVGHSGTIDPDTKKKLIHSHRWIYLVSGSWAGEGKSGLFSEYLNHALSSVGYDVNTSCPGLGSRFNLRAPLSSDLIIRDDTTNDHLAKELLTDTAKILATNGTIATEEKGKDAERTRCKAVMFILSNRPDSRLFWNMDDGTLSRIKLVETVPQGTIPAEKHPRSWIPKLAEDLDVSIDTIMLWACRLAVDNFLQYTNENASKLNEYSEKLQARSRRTSADPLDGILASIVLGYALANPGKAIPKKLNTNVLAVGINTIHRLKQDLAYMPASLALLDTVGEGIPAWHPVQGLKRLDPASLALAYDYACTTTKSITPNERIKMIFSSLSLDDGNQCYGSPGTVIPRYSSLVSNDFTRERLTDLAASIQEHVPSNSRSAFPASADYDSDVFWNL